MQSLLIISTSFLTEMNVPGSLTAFPYQTFTCVKDYPGRHKQILLSIFKHNTTTGS